MRLKLTLEYDGIDFYGWAMQQSPEELADLLDGGARADAGTTAPPWGLYLERVDY